MRYLRFWMFIILFALIMGGMGYWGYNKQYLPAVDDVNKAKQELASARSDAQSVTADYEGTFDVRKKYAKEFVNDFRVFHTIQNTMPNIICLSEVFADRPDEGVRVMYQIMGDGRYIRELNNWVHSFKLQGKLPASLKTFEELLAQSILGFEDTLPTSTIIHVPFDTEQKIVAYGYPDLLDKVRKLTGNGSYCPFYITCKGETFIKKVDNAASPAPTTPGAQPAPPSGTTPSNPGTPSSPTPPAKQDIISQISGHRTAGLLLAQGPGGSAPSTSTPPAGIGGTPSAPGTPPGTAPTTPGGTPGGDAAAGGGTDTSCGPITIAVDMRPYSPSKPKLTFTYTADAYFMLRGWDPYGNPKEVVAKVKEAVEVINSTEKADQPPSAWKYPFPDKILWFISVETPTF